MWTIGRSQRVEGKKYRPIVRKIRYIVAVSFIDGGNRRKPLRFELPTLVVIGTDCIGSCISNYHTIMTMMAPWSDHNPGLVKMIVCWYWLIKGRFHPLYHIQCTCYRSRPISLSFFQYVLPTYTKLISIKKNVLLFLYMHCIIG